MKVLQTILLCAAVFCAGCLKLDQKMVIEKDRSGRFEVKYSMAEQTIDQLKAMLKLEEQMARISGEAIERTRDDKLMLLFLDPVSDDIHRELDKYKEYGLKIDELKVDTGGAARHVNLNLTFRDLAEVAKADFFPAYGFSLVKDDQGNYVLHRPAPNEGGEMPPPVNDETARLLTPMLGGFNVALSITAPGKILRTNAHKKSLYTAMWTFDFDRNPNAVTALDNQAMTVIFSGNELNLPQIRFKPKS